MADVSSEAVASAATAPGTAAHAASTSYKTTTTVAHPDGSVISSTTASKYPGPVVVPGGAGHIAAAGVELWLGDFFALEPESAGTFAAVWDRGALVALDPPTRERYVQTIAGVLTPGGKILLSSLEHEPFPEGRVDSPYSIDEVEVRRLYAPRFEVERLPPLQGLEEDVLPDGTVLTGVEYLLTRKV